jgi:DNA repair protein SbcC/Rad50
LLQQQEDQQKLKAFLMSEQESIAQRTSTAAAQLKESRHSWQELHSMLRNQPTPYELAARRIVVLTQKKEQSTLIEKLALLEKQYAASTQTLQAQRFDLEQKHTQALQAATLVAEKLSLELQQLTTDHARLVAEQLDLHRKIDALTKILQEGQLTLKQEQAFQATWQAAKAQFEKRRTFYQRLVQLGNQDKAEQKELEQKKTLLTCSEAVACPLCSQPLSATAHHQVVTDLGRREQFLNHRLARTGSVLKTLKAILVAQHEQCALLEKQALTFAQLHTTLAEKQLQNTEFTNKKTVLDQTITQQEQMLKNITAQHQQASAARTTLAQQTALLVNHPQLVELTTTLAQLEKNIATCSESIATFVAADEMLAQLETLQLAATNRSSFEQKLATLREKSYELITTLRSLKKQSAGYTATLSELQTVDTAALAQTLAQHRTKKEEIERRKATLTLEQGRTTNSLERIALLKVEAELKQAAIKTVQSEIDDFESLAFAFGKNGIQALLIEESIPEIEQEANDLLAKLTDNQSQIFIESLRDLKSGGVKETLEIKVADAAGIRPYEMFSGGEAFRVDFALRIAISKLLARRAGTALQTLIIDEGFGSQDEDGLARIMNALYAIQNDFSKIIVVSHLNEFKENFPVHFVVDKTSSGSSVRIEERG